MDMEGRRVPQADEVGNQRQSWDKEGASYADKDRLLRQLADLHREMAKLDRPGVSNERSLRVVPQKAR